MKIVKKSVQANFFNDILNGEKNYEFRMNNFEINPGDKIVLEEEVFDGENEKEKTGRFIEKEVFHI
jgi:predicted transcriptional regulator